MNANKYASVTEWQAFRRFSLLIGVLLKNVLVLLVARQKSVLHHVTSLDRWTCSLLLLHSKCRSYGRCIIGILGNALPSVLYHCNAYSAHVCYVLLVYTFMSCISVAS